MMGDEFSSREANPNLMTKRRLARLFGETRIAFGIILHRFMGFVSNLRVVAKGS
jgi:hypothetical protein